MTIAASQEVVERLVADGVIAVVRLPDQNQLFRTAEALIAGGVHAIEVTLTVPGAIDGIRQLARELGDGHLVGVGSVILADQAQRAIDAGAKYVVSPVLRREVIDTAHRLGVPAMAAGVTPTEILDAHEAGADIVKVFPADTGGPGYIKSVLAPMPFLRLMPTGGVTPDNAGDWVKAGCVSVGIGSALVDTKAIAAGDYQRITDNAKRAIESVRSARG
ncbi:MAG: bifunctional 4-hydroxy-2-oxoglutarate aldolase/2-dehydro-3-deoxy-phosphogluconate aldolase [Phycisphaerales bacterium]|nr:bifunctional 4-hydroxy-2-oxoglutarate aldolase/2-dehydro-3-deoxy-phosphogluconate aldolase [Phycisphaerales bacterium]MCB9837140.1 bifunctional 4-hydroxy-2-oxoglutarate aldolase/2-dehydro-3-deoxy-phosphogluconate aldolase [Phycisphaera sp.]